MMHLAYTSLERISGKRCTKRVRSRAHGHKCLSSSVLLSIRALGLVLALARLTNAWRDVSPRANRVYTFLVIVVMNGMSIAMLHMSVAVRSAGVWVRVRPHVRARRGGVRGVFYDVDVR